MACTPLGEVTYLKDSSILIVSSTIRFVDPESLMFGSSNQSR